ncbi:MAG: hypothetical protein ACYC6S_04820 [Desulfobulbia bacterium]
MRIHVLALSILAFLFGCVSSSEDLETAKNVAKYLNTTGVIPENTSEAYKTHSGKIVYVGPGIHNSPHFTYYEVTSRDDMQKLKRAAEEALEKIPKANKITLHFVEKEVWHESGGGGGYRGKEKEIETIVVTKK